MLTYLNCSNFRCESADAGRRQAIQVWVRGLNPSFETAVRTANPRENASIRFAGPLGLGAPKVKRGRQMPKVTSAYHVGG